jgi:hypothetical protein
LDEPAYRRELLSESDLQWCPGGLTRSQKRRVQRLIHKSGARKGRSMSLKHRPI